MSGSLGDLLKQAGLQPSEEPAAEAPAPETDQAEPSLPKRVVIRYGRPAGGGGRKATRISGVRAGRAELLARLQGVLGVGGFIEDGEDGDAVIALQGDQVHRAARWFEDQGCASEGELTRR